MHFVPEVSTFINYLDSRNSFKKSNKDRLRQNIFENSSNSIVFCREFVELIEKLIDDSHELKDQCNILIKSLIDNVNNESLNINLSTGLSEPDEVFEGLIKHVQKDTLIIGVSEECEDINGVNKVLNLNNLAIDSKNYIFSKLLTNEVCQIRHLDLKENNDIIPLLNHVYDLYDQYPFVVIIDRHANVNHKLYDHLINKSILFKYYKLKANISDGRAVKTKFLNYELHSTNNAEIIHERCLIIKDIVITMDEDPFNIGHRKTWTITIEFSANSANKIIKEKCSKFIKTRY